jgi:hypothetical protein
MNNLKIRVVDVSPSGIITLEVINSSKKRIRIWNESNSWGAARWRVLLIRKGQLESFFQNPDQDFTRNIPTFKEIPSGSHFEKRLDLQGGDWRHVAPEKVNFAKDDQVVVVYDVPFTNEALKMGVWYGVTAALTTVQ